MTCYHIPPQPSDPRDKLLLGGYYPFVMKNGTKGHTCVGLVLESGIYVTNMRDSYDKEDILWVGEQIIIDFPEEFERKYL